MTRSSDECSMLMMNSVRRQLAIRLGAFTEKDEDWEG
jgi:hypothetical protein